MSRQPRVSRDDPSSPDDAIEAVAADWVTRIDAGLTREEQQIFQDWLGQDARHADAFDRYTEAWSVFDRVQERGAASVILDRLSGRARQRKARRVRAGIAAGLIVVAGLFWLQWRAAAPGVESRSPPPVAVTPVAPDPIRRLPDGSIVELNGNAEIAVQYSETERRVKLVKGEAFFQVEKNKARPFYVEANGVVVRAVGTAFAVQMNPSAVEVVVKEGAVDVNRTATPAADPIRVEAGKRVVMPMMLLRPATRAGSPSATGSAAPAAEEAIQPEELSNEQMDARLAWRLPWINFDGMTLAEAVVQMNRHNRLQLRVEDPGLGKTRVGGIYRADNPDGLLRMLEKLDIARGEHVGPDEVVLRPIR